MSSKAFTLLFTFFFVSIDLVGQNFFVQFYNAGGREVSVTCTTDGEQVLIGGITDAGPRGQNRAIVNFLDLDGRVNQTITSSSFSRTLTSGVLPVGNEPGAGFMIATFQGNFGSVDDAVFYRLDQNANTLDSFGWGTNSEDEQPRRLLRLESGDFVFLGDVATTDQALIRCFTPTGETKWSRSFSTAPGTFHAFQDGIEVSDGIVVVGFEARGGERNARTIVAKVSLAGELMWSYLIDHPRMLKDIFRTVAVGQNREIFVTNSISGENQDNDVAILRLSSAGDLLDTKVLSGPHDEFLNVVQTTQSGNYLFAGRTNPAGEPTALIVELDPQGEVRNQRTLVNNQSTEIRDICINPDSSGYYFTGFGNECPGLGDQDLDMMLVFLENDLSNDLENCSSADPELTVVPLENVTIRTAGSFSERTIPSVTAVQLTPDEATASDYNCPLLDLNQNDTICRGDSIRLLPGNPAPGTEYTISSSNFLSQDFFITVAPNTTTTYTILAATNCAETTDSFTLHVIPEGSISVSGDSQLCGGMPLRLTARIEPPELSGTFVWNTPDGDLLPGAELELFDPVPGIYSVTFLDENDCQSITTERLIEENPDALSPVVIALTSDGEELTTGQMIPCQSTMTLFVSGLPDDLEYTYAWTGNRTPATSTSPQLVVTLD
ncbi:MAG: hypothetical protein AAFN92_00460, partial [Bacteroidota bacterium]